MVSGMQTIHTSKSEIARWKRNNWTADRWPRRRLETITEATIELPNKPTREMDPLRKKRKGADYSLRRGNKNCACHSKWGFSRSSCLILSRKEVTDALTIASQTGILIGGKMGNYTSIQLEVTPWRTYWARLSRETISLRFHRLVITNDRGKNVTIYVSGHSS